MPKEDDFDGENLMFASFERMKKTRDLVLQYKQGNQDALEELTSSFLYIVDRYEDKRQESREELLEVLYQAILKAIEHFKPEEDAPFYLLVHYCFKEILDQGSVVE